MKSRFVPLLAALLLPACQKSPDEDNARRATELGEQLVEAIRRQDADFVRQHLDPRWADEMSASELEKQLADLKRRHGALEAPALTDLGLLSEEDYGEQGLRPEPASAAYEYYAAMLTDGSGKDGTEGVDARLRLSVSPEQVRLFDWDFEALTTE